MLPLEPRPHKRRLRRSLPGGQCWAALAVTLPPSGTGRSRHVEGGAPVEGLWWQWRLHRRHDEVLGCEHAGDLPAESTIGCRELLWAAGAGPGDGSTCLRLRARNGYTGKRGYHPLLAVAAGTGDVLMSRLRQGRANTARGAAHFLRETWVGCAMPVPRQLTMRADSGFYAHAIVAVCRKCFSITVNSSVGEWTGSTWPRHFRHSVQGRPGKDSGS